ncbi:sac1 [Symbiodinium sp. CCMP2592]|nr:sac1 [Symbiodinium sp. CCMP2592]
MSAPSVPLLLCLRPSRALQAAKTTRGRAHQLLRFPGSNQPPSVPGAMQMQKLKKPYGMEENKRRNCALLPPPLAATALCRLPRRRGRDGPSASDPKETESDGCKEDEIRQAIRRDTVQEHVGRLGYTGTASTMGAALRQGGHTARAMLEKGWRAVNRAYCAHFEDDARQSAIQLLLRSQKLAKAPSIPELRRSPQGKLRLALASWNLHGRAPWQSPETLRSR